MSAAVARPWVPPPGKPELVVAVDTPTLDDALRLRDQLAGTVGFFKIGKELFTAAGPRAVRELAAGGRVFVDLKFHDIPATVAGAVAAAGRSGAAMVDVHASGGRAMVEAAAGASADMVLLAVTVLTSLDPEAAAEVFGPGAIGERVLRLARLSLAAGAAGVVASAHELEALRADFGAGPVVLVPGVRPRWAASAQDQRRVATPREAADRGANYVVLGRAITGSDDPRSAALRVQDEIG